MTTTVTHTIKTSGGDYTSLAAWESAQQRDLVSLDEIAAAECYDGAYTGLAGIFGWTTGSANYIRIYTPTAERHDGTSRDVSGVGAQFKYDGSTTDDCVLYISEDYVRLEGLEIKNTAASGGPSRRGALIVDTAPTGGGLNQLLLQDCIFIDGVGSNVPAVWLDQGALNAILRNCIIIVRGNSQGIGNFDGTSGTLEVSHCTILDQGSGTYGLVTQSQGTVKNTYAGGFGTEDFYTGGVAPTGSHNASSDSSASTDFTRSLTSKAASNQFVSVTSGSEDLHLKTGSDLEAAGTPLGAVTTDIDGDARDGSTPDIGADERVSTAVTGTMAGTLAVVTAALSGLAMQILRPDGDASAGAWTRENLSGTGLYLSIDETSADDADYIRSENSPASSVVRVRLTDGSAIPDAGAGRVSFRYRKAGTATVNLVVRLKQGVTTIKTWTKNNISETVTQADETLSAGEVASITDRRDLELEFEANAP
jgi:hypothetical protein